MTPAEAHISIKNLTMAYGSFVIQHDLTFTIQRGARTTVRDWSAEQRFGQLPALGAQELRSGMAVIIGARISASAKASEVLVSSTVKELVAGSDLTLEADVVDPGKERELVLVFLG